MNIIILMAKTGVCAVTGAFSYSGKYIARRLLAKGYKVKTITGRCDPGIHNPHVLEVCPYEFNSPSRLARAFQGVDVFYNTYWIRFPYQDLSYEQAVENNKVLIRAAGHSGVQRIVNISITNPGINSAFPYFRGKAQVDDALIHSGLSYAILRPAVIFGREDILINNIAWLLRRFPVFAIPGDGDYQVQPIFVEDLAELAVEAGESRDNLVMDAVGPEVYGFEEMVRLIAKKIGKWSLMVHVSPEFFLQLTRVLNPLVGDIILTRDEVFALMAGLLVSDKGPSSKTRLSDWLAQNAKTVGKKYSSELEKHYK